MKNVIVVDLDGTVRDGKHREHFIKGGEKQWDAYFQACGDDLPILPVIKCIQALASIKIPRPYDLSPIEYRDEIYEYRIVIMSGCGESAREITWRWIEEHMIPADRVSHLLMRPKGNFEPDFMLKKQWALEIGINTILMAFEDRNGVVEMWRSLGIQCLQVAPGDF